MAELQLHVGDKVKLLPEASYYNGRQIPPMIKTLTWEISSISGNRVVLGKSSDGSYTLNAPVSSQYLIKPTA